MQIGELAQRTGASRRSIRYYEQQGLLEAQRTGRRWRTYDARGAPGAERT
ncbi:MerR family DNA-binding transcriptional regulator [Streptomyces rimosus]|nr:MULTISPECIES: MerR family DNA-binding transcriptional regulator [Streptomyces]